MIEAVDTRARGLRPAPRREPSARRRSSAGSTGCCSARSAALLGYGLWAIDGITRHDIPGDPTTSSPTGDLRRGRRRRLCVAAMLHRPGRLPALQAADLHRHAGRDAARARSPGTVSRHSKRWLDIGFFRFQPSEFGKLLFVLFLAGFLADRAKRIGETRTVLEAIGLGADPDPARVRPAGRRHRDGLHGRARRSAVRRGRALAAPGERSARRRSRWSWRCSGSLPAAGVHVLKPYQAQRLTGFTHPDSDPAGATYNVRQSHQRRRRGRRARARRGGRDPDEPELPARSTRPTSRSPRSPSSAASSASRCCCCSTCSSSGAA